MPNSPFSSPFDQLVRVVLAAGTVDVLSEPPAQRPELSTSDLLRYLWVLLHRLFEELRGEDVSDGVGREVADGP